MIPEEYLLKVKQDMNDSGIRMNNLKDDLLDHFCCFIEEEMSRGLSFPEAYQKAKQHICPGGLIEIQQETIFLLHSKRILQMKKLLYLIGLGSSMSTGLGLLLKLMHMPGAGELLDYGVLVFAFGFLPLLVFHQLRTGYSKIISEKLQLVFLLVSSVFVASATIFKLQNMMEPASLLVTIGMLVFIFGFLPTLFFRMYTQSER